MDIRIEPDKVTMGQAAATFGAQRIRDAIAARGEATIVVATGASQFEMLDALTKEQAVAWEKVTVFHLDEYVGLSIRHPASFRAYLWQRFHSRLPMPLRAFHYVDAERDPDEECARLSGLIGDRTVDVAFIGIGENGHLAFNDPPADFETDTPYIVVKLDDACCRQQVGEGWFASLDDVPRRAISMSIREIMRAACIVCTVPDERKAEAVRAAVHGPVRNTLPASILQQHANTTLFLDPPAASLVKET